MIGTTCMLLCGFLCATFRAADRGCEVSTRPSLRPLGQRGWSDKAKLGRNQPRDRVGVSGTTDSLSSPAKAGDPVLRDSCGSAERSRRTGFPAFAGNDSCTWRTTSMPHTPSLRAQRSNPDCHRGKILDCFAVLAKTVWRECAQNPQCRPGLPQDNTGAVAASLSPDHNQVS